MHSGIKLIVHTVLVISRPAKNVRLLRNSIIIQINSKLKVVHVQSSPKVIKMVQEINIPRRFAIDAKNLSPTQCKLERKRKMLCCRMTNCTLTIIFIRRIVLPPAPSPLLNLVVGDHLDHRVELQVGISPPIINRETQRSSYDFYRGTLMVQ